MRAPAASSSRRTSAITSSATRSGPRWKRRRRVRLAGSQVRASAGDAGAQLVDGLGAGGELGLYVHLHCLATDGAFEERGTGVHFLAPPEPAARPPLTESAFGMHLHAATTVDGRDRKQLERVCRYMLRPPFAHDAVQALPDGRVRVLFKAAWRSGAAHADMSQDKFLARLCALVPPPGFHMTRYFGVFANRHHLRPRIIPPSPVPTPGQQLALGLADSASGKPDDTESSPRPRRLGWAKLLAGVFAVAVTLCRKCGGRMRILEVVDTADDIARVLHGARAPPRPHPPVQVLLFPG
jgi:hypothetical protein